MPPKKKKELEKPSYPEIEDEPSLDKFRRDMILYQFFILSNKGEAKYISREHIPLILYQCGLCPSKQILAAALSEIDDPEHSRQISQPQLLEIYDKYRKAFEGIEKDDLIPGMSIFDPDGTGLVNYEVFRQAMELYGEGLSDEELSVLDKYFPGGPDADGNVNYFEFLELICSKK